MTALWILALLALPVPAENVLICYADAPAGAKAVPPGVDALLRVLERLSGTPASALQADFQGSTEGCRAGLTRRPALAILPLSMFLEHREAHHLRPLVRPVVGGQSVEVLRVVARRGTVSQLSDLKGKTLGGTPVDAPLFLKKVVFTGTLDPTTDLVLKPEQRALKALRRLQAGALDAVLITGAQHQSLPALPFAGELEVVHAFEPLPLVGLVVDTTQVDAARQTRLAAALAALCGDAEGKALCEAFGVEAFAPVDEAAYGEVVRRWSAP